LFGSLALCSICVFGGVALIWPTVPWYAAGIGCGAMVLIAPLLLQPFPDSFVNSRDALITFSSLSLLLTVLLFCAAPARV
jgi:hypothetical protein